MKIIELLNMIAECKKVPENIKYKEKWYKLIEYGNDTKLYQCVEEPFEIFVVKTDDLNETLEIIENEESEEN